MQYNFNHPAGGFALKVFTISGLYSRTIRTKDGRQFAPFSIEFKDNKLILCENEEAE